MVFDEMMIMLVRVHPSLSRAPRHEQTQSSPPESQLCGRLHLVLDIFRNGSVIARRLISSRVHFASYRDKAVFLDFEPAATL